ncbi:glucan endo-1,3-beta-glucosidase-like [Vigna radiata var. radiata]|uniref:glucan endo-1,3-beta-D-glucosidase n=1 Tax=Vigna radiata var. radiata TaxID=3916 RepID=A0A3Q0F3B5_VIGRR|nr:glucan endo-1,3-beta-glucosidase-like [Vigna radiata var. radiata]
MAQTQSSSRNSFLLLLSCTLFRQLYASNTKIGVNYGTKADNLPPPSTVATFLKSQTTIDRVKIFDANPDILRAFAGTGISVTVTVANAAIPSLSTLPAAQAWLSQNISPFLPETAVTRISVGNEVVESSDETLIANILPAMKSLHDALSHANHTTVQVSTPHSLGILASSEPPSAASFLRGYDKSIFGPMLDFLRRTKSPFMVNPYPFFGIAPTDPETLNYALFKENSGVWDAGTSVNYTNMFDAQMDAIFSAMKKLGYDDVELVVAETGWPSVGEPKEAGVSFENAASYNGNLIKHVNSGKGTPLMPDRTFETFIFSLFNENLKPTVSERNYGLFNPDLTPVYDVGVSIAKEASVPTSGPGPTSGPSPISGPASPPATSPISGRKSGLSPTSAPASGPSPTSEPVSGPTALTPSEAPSSSSSSSSKKKWCVPKGDASEAALQANIDFVCKSSGIECGAIDDGGKCFKPNTVRSHAAYAMNAYYQASGGNDLDCDFNNTGLITYTDRSSQECKSPDAATGMKTRKPDEAGSITRGFHNNLFFICISFLISFTFF